MISFILPFRRYSPKSIWRKCIISSAIRSPLSWFSQHEAEKQKTLMIELVSYAFMEIFYFCKLCLTSTCWQYCIDFSIVNPARLVAVCSLSRPNITSCYRQKFVENPTHFQPQLNSFVFLVVLSVTHAINVVLALVASVNSENSVNRPVFEKTCATTQKT